jgi:hypothetical protein
MSSPPTPPVIPRQYDIEVGPWDDNGNPTRHIHFTNLQTNCTYVYRNLSPTIPIGLMFCRGGFMRYNLETPENMKSVWMINLTSVRIVCLATHLNPPFIAPRIDPRENTRTGSIVWLKFNTIYILQHEDR